MELYKGRPETDEGRLEREIRVYDFLDDHGIEYWRTDHAPADTMEVCSEIDAVLGATIWIFPLMFVLSFACYLVISLLQMKRIKRIPMDEALKNVE